MKIITFVHLLVAKYNKSHWIELKFQAVSFLMFLMQKIIIKGGPSRLASKKNKEEFSIISQKHKIFKFKKNL